MANVDPLFEMLKNVKDAPLPDDYHDQVSTAYIRDMESRDEKIRALETENAAKEEKVREYAVANFDLVRKASTGGTIEPEKKDEPPKRMSLSDIVNKIKEK